ncbi:cilia- and flagella-associated protein 141 isoform X1 [Pseudophryne corroboree]|uniref:cilia- and flagella-associated protein 141 isoform X1 n=1 Tax=Pseudophryne corroboree TaxID=495146 RepID=UPI0030818EBA
MLTTRMLQHTKSVTQRNDLLRVAEMELQREQALNIHNAWKEDARGTIASRIQRRQSALVRQELKMANKELVLVRRAALQRLLQDEHRQYQEELIRLGKTFFGQRL